MSSPSAASMCSEKSTGAALRISFCQHRAAADEFHRPQIGRAKVLVYDTVWDFSVAEGDKVRIDPALAGSFAEFQSRLSGFSFDGADFAVFLSADGLDQLTIKGIAHTAWTADLVT
jgi:hypothetical protein